MPLTLPLSHCPSAVPAVYVFWPGQSWGWVVSAPQPGLSYKYYVPEPLFRTRNSLLPQVGFFGAWLRSTSSLVTMKIEHLKQKIIHQGTQSQA